MKKTIRSGLALLLIAAMLLPFGAVRAAEPRKSLAEMQADALLYGSRKWVVDSLVYDQWGSNPMALVLGNLDQSMARTALERFEGRSRDGDNASLLFVGLVNGMYAVKNAEDVVAGFVDEATGELIAAFAQLINLTELQKTANTVTATRRQITYDNLLKSIYTAEYTASDGTTLEDLEAEETLLNELKTLSDYLNKLIAAVNAANSTVTEAAERSAIYAEYVENYALPYQDAVEEAFNAFGELIGGEENASSRAAARFTAALAAITQMEIISPKESVGSFGYADFQAEWLEETGIAELLTLAGKTVKAADTALDSHLFIRSIQQKRDSLQGPMDRLSRWASTRDMRESAANFSRLMGEQYDNKLLSWDSIQTYCRNNQLVSGLISHLVKKKVLNLLHLTKDYALGSALAELTAIVGIAVYIVNKATGLSEMVEKAFELRYWNDLAVDMVSVYHTDKEAYLDAPGEKTAQNLLDDLSALRRIRLFGEKIAYELASAPNDKWLGWAMGGQETQAGLDKHYQKCVDVLMTTDPGISLKSITVPAGQEMNIAEINGVLCGTIGNTHYVEMEQRLAAGVTVYGTLRTGVSGTLCIGYVEAGNGAVLEAKHGSLLIGELNQTGQSMTLSAANGQTIACTERAALRDVTADVYDGFVFRTGDLSLNGTVPLTVEARGNLSGSGTVPRLLLTGDRQRVEGAIAVTELLSGPSAGVEGGKSLVFSGTVIRRNDWPGDLTLSGADLTDVRFRGSVEDRGGTHYRGDCRVDRALTLKAASTLEGGTLSVYGTAEAKAALEGTGKLRLYGDLFVTDGISFGPALGLQGKVPQEVSGSFTVGSLRFANTGQGIRVRGRITVRTALENPAGRVTCDQPFYVEKDAVVSSGFACPLSVENWTVPEDMVLNSDLTVRSGGVLKGTSGAVKGILKLPEGGGLDGLKLTVRTLQAPASLTLDKGAVLTVQGCGEMGGAVTGDGELIVGDDLFLKGVTADVPIRAAGDLTVQAASSLASLTLNGSRPQHITGAALQTAWLKVTGSADRPLYLTQTLTVTGALDAPHLRVTGGGSIVGGLVSAAITEDTAVPNGLCLTDPLTVTGCTLTVEGPLTVPQVTLTEASLIVRGNLNLTGGASVLDASSSLTVQGTLTSASGTIQNEGTAEIAGDLILHSTAVTGGAVTLGGDLFGAGSIQLDSLTRTGKGRQRTQASGLVIRLPAQAEGDEITQDLVLPAGLTRTEPLTVTGCRVEINGPVSLPSLTLTEAQVTVNGPLTLTGGTTKVDEDSRLTVRGTMEANSGTLTVDGTLEVRSDLQLRGAALTGGTVILGGDLCGTGALRPASLTLNGLVRQRVEASNLETGSLILANASRGGVVLKKDLRVTGAAEPGNTALFGGEHLIRSEGT